MCVVTINNLLDNFETLAGRDKTNEAVKLTINCLENLIESIKKGESSLLRGEEETIKEFEKEKSLVIEIFESKKQTWENTSNNSINNETPPKQFPTALTVGVIIVIAWLIFKR